MRPVTRTALVVIGLHLMASAAPAQTDPNRRSPDVLVQQGSAAMQAGRYREAFDAFYQASQLRPRDVSLYTAAANAAALLGQFADAQRWLERAVQIEPGYTPASLLLGQVLFRMGKVPEAIRVYETALQHAPGNTALTSSLEQWRKEADLQSRFFERRGAHFTVLFEGAADDAVARRIVDILEDAYYRVGTALMTYPAETITVVLYTGQQFQDITRSPAWADGIYDGRIKLPVAGALKQESDLRRVAEHELVHAVVSTMAGRAVPTWLHEGLAMALEDGQGAQAEQLLRSTTSRIPLSALGNGFTSMTGAQAALAYAESVRAVKRLVADRGMPSIVSLLHALGRGAPFESAFEQTMYVRFADFDADLARR